MATQVGTYHVAQECYSKHDIENPLTHVPSAPEQPPKTKLENIKVASPNLNGGISHMSGREKIVHLMDRNEIDFLALQETRINTDSREEHGGYVFHFSTSISYATKKEASRIRQEQNAMNNKTMSEIELYNLDSEKQGVALLYGTKLRSCKLNVHQINDAGNFRNTSFRDQPHRCVCSACWHICSG